MIWLLALVLGFAGSSGPAPVATASAVPAPTPTRLPTEPELSAVQQQFLERDPLPSCGTYDLGLDPLATGARPGWRCLRQASATGAGGELALQLSTDEGDPVAQYYRVTPDGTLEIYVDTTKDSFGPREWTLGTCPVPDTALHLGCP